MLLLVQFDMCLSDFLKREAYAVSGNDGTQVINRPMQARFCLEICKGLLYLGDMGVVHGDVCSEHIYVQPMLDRWQCRIGGLHHAHIRGERVYETKAPPPQLRWLSYEVRSVKRVGIAHGGRALLTGGMWLLITWC